MPRHDKERVVDADGEPDHDGEQRRRTRHFGEGRDADDASGRDCDADDCAQQGHACGEQRTEGDDEHDSGDKHPEALGRSEAGGIVLQHAATEGDGESGIVSDGGRVEHRIDSGLRDLARGCVELHLGEGHRLVVADGEASVLVEWVNNGVDSFDRGQRIRLFLNRRLVFSVGHRGPRRHFRHHLHARASYRGEHGREAVKRFLRLGARNSERLLAFATERQTTAEHGDEEGDPDADDDPRAAERESTEAIEKGGQEGLLGSDRADGNRGEQLSHDGDESNPGLVDRWHGLQLVLVLAGHHVGGAAEGDTEAHALESAVGG